jgi:hypothetical protein
VDWFWMMEHSHSPSSLFAFWEQYKDRTFMPNERIVVLDVDHAYHQAGSVFNDDQHNLFVTLNYFNIPSDFIIYLANYPVEPAVDYLCNLLTLPKPQIHYCEYMENWVPSDLKQFAGLNLDQIKHHYICLNGHSRAHRIDLLCLLKQHQIFEQGLITYNFGAEQVPDDLSIKTTTDLAGTGIGYRTSIPFSRINGRYAKNSRLIAAYNNHCHEFINQTKTQTLAGSYLNQVDRYITNLELHPIQHAAVYLITETLMEYPHPYTSEKTWKGILYKRPFIVAGTPGSIKKLHRLGFKTFDSFWSEKYDQIDNTSDRICAVVDLVRDLCQLPLTQLSMLVEEMEPIFEYNINVFKEQFSKRDLQTLLNRL